MKRKAEITFEVEETITLRDESRMMSIFCPVCLTTVEMITPRAIADLTDFTEREIFRLIEGGKIHFIETAIIYVCWSSFRKECFEPGPAGRQKKKEQ